MHLFIACLNLHRVSPTWHKYISFPHYFTTVSRQVSLLLGELERRARVHPDELRSLLSECNAAYFSARKNFLVSRITEQIRVDPTRTELVKFVRVSLLRGLSAG